MSFVFCIDLRHTHNRTDYIYLLCDSVTVSGVRTHLLEHHKSVASRARQQQPSTAAPRVGVARLGVWPGPAPSQDQPEAGAWSGPSPPSASSRPSLVRAAVMEITVLEPGEPGRSIAAHCTSVLLLLQHIIHSLLSGAFLAE